MNADFYREGLSFIWLYIAVTTDTFSGVQAHIPGKLFRFGLFFSAIFFSLIKDIASSYKPCLTLFAFQLSIHSNFSTGTVKKRHKLFLPLIIKHSPSPKYLKQPSPCLLKLSKIKTK